MQIFFTVPGVPVAKARPRGRVITNKFTGKQFVGMYTPKTTVSFENKVAAFCYEKYSGPPVDCAVSLSIRTYFPIPKSWPKKKLLEAQTVSIPVTTKPDVDNVVKAIFDGLNGVLFTDDKQVYALSITKQYSINPRTEIQVTTVS